MFQPKPIDADAIPRALEKADRFRLLNEPEEAESICLDILTVDPDNQRASVILLLALTDQFHHDCADCLSRAQGLLVKMQGPYERHYYAGIISERRASALLDKRTPGGRKFAYTLLREAMEHYEQAEAIRPPQNDDAILRWNTCVRMLNKYELSPTEESFEPVLLE
jgi:hypothetical protein